MKYFWIRYSIFFESQNNGFIGTFFQMSNQLEPHIGVRDRCINTCIFLFDMRPTM